MAGFSGEDDDIIAGINITPLVDIILVVLIIFMVTTSYIVKAQINIDLPKAASGQSEVQETIALQIKADGTFYMNAKKTTLKEIGQWAREAKKRNPEIRAIIAADKKVPYESVVDLIDAIKTNGIEKFALNIVRKKQ